MNGPAQIISAAPLVAFTTAGVQPPAQSYLTRDDHLFLRVWNSAAGVTVSLRYRFLDPKLGVLAGTVPLIPSTDRLANFLRIPLGEGFLLSVTLSVSAGTPKRGQTFCQAGVVRGGELANEPAALLISDYLADTCLLAWPGGPLRSSTEGPGFLRSLTGTNPAANTEISETVPTNARWKLRGLVATLVCGAAVANRKPTLVIDDGASQLLRYSGLTNVTASQTVQFSAFQLGVGTQNAGVWDYFITGEAAEISAGWRLRTITTAIQAADDWSAPQIFVEEWIEE